MLLTGQVKWEWRRIHWFEQCEDFEWFWQDHSREALGIETRMEWVEIEWIQGNFSKNTNRIILKNWQTDSKMHIKNAKDQE